MTSRTAHHIQDISDFKQLVPEESYRDGNEDDDCQHEDEHEHGFHHDEDLLDLNFDPIAQDLEACINIFKDDADSTLGQSDKNYTSQTISSTTHLITRDTSVQVFASTAPFSQPHTAKPTSTQRPFPSSSTSNSSDSNKYRCHCGYAPSGEEKWKASNLRRHKRTQHPTEVKTHRCGYLGCKSEFTRSDNLRSHRRDKGHFVGYDEGSGSGEGMLDMGVGMGVGDVGRERGSKRRRGGGEDRRR